MSSSGGATAAAAAAAPGAPGVGSTVDEAIAKTLAKPVSATQHAAPPPPEGFRVLTEHSAHLLFPVDNEVFYNNAQIFNRDLSVLVARLVLARKRADDDAKLAKRAAKWEAARDAGKPLHTGHPAEGADTGSRILDALSASGMRAIRYAKELEGLSLVVANDYDASAVESIRRNVEFNGLSSSLVVAKQADAAMTMMEHRSVSTRFDLVDLDPFGSPAAFLDSAVQSVSDGGLLAVTCTDMAVLCGNHSEACFGKYGAMPLRGKHCHEFALRLVLGCLQTHAARHRRYIVPVVSCSIDFYVRLFVRVYTSPQEVKKSASKLSHVYQCGQCRSFALQPLGVVRRHRNGTRCRPPAAPSVGEACEHCGGAMKMTGPIWHGPIQDASFVQEALRSLERGGAADVHTKATPHGAASQKKLRGLFGALAAEADLAEQPLFMTSHGMAATLGCIAPPLDVFERALRDAGFQAGSSHTNPLAVRTDAPLGFMWDVLRAWVASGHGGRAKRAEPNSAAASILSRHSRGGPEQVEAILDGIRRQGPGSNAKRRRRGRTPFFLPNPEPHWGPKSRQS